MRVRKLNFYVTPGRRTIIKSKFARNRRSVEKHLTNRNGVCLGISVPARKKTPREGGARRGGRGGSDKKVAGRREPCVCASHATRDGYLHFYVTKAAISLCLSISPSFSIFLLCRSSELRDSSFCDFRKSREIRRFSPVVWRKTRTVILNSLGGCWTWLSSNIKQAWRSARRKTIYRCFQASLCENPRSNFLSNEPRALFNGEYLRPFFGLLIDNKTRIHCNFLNSAMLMESYWYLIEKSENWNTEKASFIVLNNYMHFYPST